MTALSPLHAERFHSLLREIRDDLGGGYGWISVAARRLGLHRSTLVKVLNGTRPVTSGMIDRATVALGLDARFFSASQDHHMEPKRVAQDVELDALAVIARLDVETWNRVRAWGDARHAVIASQEDDRRSEMRALLCQDRARASERYRQLILSIGERKRHEYGWKSEAARDLGIRPSHLEKIITRQINGIKPQILERAIERLGLSPSYFLAPDDTPASSYLET